jgi:pilus assembly protein Flp/PilA
MPSICTFGVAELSVQIGCGLGDKATDERALFRFVESKSDSRKEVINLLYLPREHQEGQGLVEYALILVLVAIVVIAILVIMGPQIGNIFSQITNALAGT